MRRFQNWLASVHTSLRHGGWLGLLLLAAACAPQQAASVVRIADAPASSATQAQIFVTPTIAPSAIPTLVPRTPSATPTIQPSPTPTQNPAQQQALCAATLRQLYQSAGELCLGQPSGYFCNGGAAPGGEPQGRVLNSLSVPGALVEAASLTMVHSRPLLENNSGGVLWLHLADEISLNALLLGDVELRDVTPANINLPQWQAVTVKTTHPSESCGDLPYSAFVVQSLYGIPTRLAINGVSIDLRGTLAVQTDEQLTRFILLEGAGTLTVLGQARDIVPGQQLNVAYPPNDFTFPASSAAEARPLEWEYVRNMPVMIFDRPVLLPQPGYASTLGNVNMRAAPDISARLLYQVPSGETLSILGSNTAQDWLHIRLGNGDTGWMRGDLLNVQLGEVSARYDTTPEPPQRLGDLGKFASVVVPAGSNLRRAPDVSFPAISTVPQGTLVALLARSPYSPWVKVDADGQVGWIALVTLETQAAISFLPVDYDVPYPVRPTAVPTFAFGGGHAYPDPRRGG